jgi:hypothetical protein
MFLSERALELRTRMIPSMDRKREGYGGGWWVTVGGWARLANSQPLGKKEGVICVFARA